MWWSITRGTGLANSRVELRNGRTELIRATGAVLVASVLLYFPRHFLFLTFRMHNKKAVTLFRDGLNNKQDGIESVSSTYFNVAWKGVLPGSLRKEVADPVILAHILAGLILEDRLSVRLGDEPPCYPAPA